MTITEVKESFRNFITEFNGEENAAKVVGMPIKDIEAAFGGSEKHLERITDFFETRSYAYKMYDAEQAKLLSKFEHLIVTAGTIRILAD